MAQSREEVLPGLWAGAAPHSAHTDLVILAVLTPLVAETLCFTVWLE